MVAASTACADEQVQPAKLLSTETLDAAALNERLRTRPRNGNPISLVLDLVSGTAETPHVRVDMASDPKTDFNRVTVTVVRDGFQDDSMRGDWHEFVLTRAADGAWTVNSAHRAYRCWRGKTKGFAARICP